MSSSAWAGERLPRDFEWPLFREVVRILPWLAKTPRTGILPLKGPRTPDGGIILGHRSRIVIRLPRDRVCSASALERESLHVGDVTLTVGEGTFRKHLATPTLYSPRVATGESDEARFLAVLEEEITALGVRARLICGRRVEVELEEGRVTAYPVAVHDLREADPSCCSAPGSAAVSRWAAASSFPTRPSSPPSSGPRENPRHDLTVPQRTGGDGGPHRPHLPRPDPRRPRDPRGLRDGQVLLLLSDCPGTRDDLFAWARQTGNEVIHTEPRDRGATAITCARAAAAPWPRTCASTCAACPAPARSWRRASSSRA